MNLSLSRDEIAQIKSAAGLERYPRAEFSLAFALELLSMAAARIISPHAVLDEIDVLEGLRSRTSTKPAKRFRGDLRMFWHKHFFSPGFVVPNLIAHWDQSPKGDGRLIHAVAEASRAGSDWAAVLAHEMTIGAFEKRGGERRLTGEWIVFRPYLGKRYYLAIASHKESKGLLGRLRRSCKAEFPFLF